MLPEDNLIHEDNLRAREVEDSETFDQDPAVSSQGTDGGSRTPAKSDRRSIDVVFDLDDPEQVKKLEWHKRAFGDDHTEIEPLGDGKVVLKLYPGGARRLP